MTAKEYLRQLKKIDTQLGQIESEIEKLRADLTSTTIKPKEVNVLSSVQLDPMGNTLALIVDLQMQYERKWDRLIKLRSTIVEQIQSLDNPIYMEILYLKYVEHKKYLEWSQVFNEIRDKYPEAHYSDRQLYRIHGIALIEFAKHVSECQ